MIEAAVLPLRDLVVFPRMVSPIFVGREGSLLAVQEAQNKEQTVIGLTQHDPDLDHPGVGRFPADRRGDGGGAVAANAGWLALRAGAGTPPCGDRGVHPHDSVSDGASPRHHGAASGGPSNAGPHAFGSGPVRALRPA